MIWRHVRWHSTHCCLAARLEAWKCPMECFSDDAALPENGMSSGDIFDRNHRSASILGRGVSLAAKLMVERQRSTEGMYSSK